MPRGRSEQRALLVVVVGEAWVSGKKTRSCLPSESLHRSAGWVACWVSEVSHTPAESLATWDLPPYGQSLRMTSCQEGNLTAQYWVGFMGIRTAVPGGLGPMSYCGLFAEDRAEGGEEALW